jgi:hypothetical protein
MNEEVQINFISDIKTKQELKKIAHKRSIELDKDITYLDLIKETIQKLIELSGSNK